MGLSMPHSVIVENDFAVTFLCFLGDCGKPILSPYLQGVYRHTPANSLTALWSHLLDGCDQFERNPLVCGHYYSSLIQQWSHKEPSPLNNSRGGLKPG